MGTSHRRTSCCAKATASRCCWIYSTSRRSATVASGPPPCVPKWEGLTDEQLDRFATTKIVRDLIAAATTADDAVLRDLAHELGRPRIETLEPVAIALRDALHRIEAAKPPTFRIAFQNGKGPFVSDGGRYYLPAESIGPS